MIDVRDLTKTYYDKVAVDGISFKVGKGEVVGFLGANGAGKSTTMRILSGYLPPSAGTVKVAGFDIVEESLQARRRIGYMPENVPLYPDMRVREYLHYRALLKGLSGAGMRERVGEVMELCGLTDVRRRLIGVLSKGFRQRVGLADALIHDPDLLILDEPTNGLDPNQIRQVRHLIKSLGQRHTILLSTHILSEVEAACDRVLIIHEGRIKAQDKPAELSARLKGSGTVMTELKGAPRGDVERELRALEGVTTVTAADPDGGDWIACELQVSGKEDVREAIFDLALRKRWQLRRLEREALSLEDVFVDLTREEPKE